LVLFLAKRNFDVLTFVAPYILASALRWPGHGHHGTSGHRRVTKKTEAGFRFYDSQTIE